MGGFVVQDASHVATFMHPYLKCMLRLKMMAEDQHKPTKAKKARMLSSVQQKSASKSSSPQVIQQKAASKSSSPQAMALHEPKSRGSHPQTVIDCAVEWLRISRGIDSNPQRYYRDLCMMWTSGEFEWARNQPIPSQTQVYYWLKNSRRERPAHVDSKIGNKKQRVAQAQQAMKRLALVLKSRLTDFRAGSKGQLALFKCLDLILLLYMDRSNYLPVLLLAQISKSTNLRLRRSEVYSQVQRIMQGRLMDVDARLVLQQLEGSSSNAAGGQENSQAVKQPSSIQIHVDFSNLAVSLQANALKGYKGDFKDTIVNLGDVLGTERLFYIGEGGFGSVFACPDKRMAIKVFKRPGLLESVVKDLANEASCFHLASTLNRMSSSGSRGVAASRNKLLPFAPLPIVDIAGSTSGAMALPSWGLGGRFYYPALVMELAIGSINSETRELSKSFFSDPMGAVTDEGFFRLAALMRFVAEPLAAMHSLNLAHRDVKEDNILALRVAPGVNGNIYYSTAGKKWTGRLGDCGKALSFDVQFETGPEATGSAAVSKRAKTIVSGLPAHDGKLQAFPHNEFKPAEGMAAKLGTVPLVIPMGAIHVINPVAPSTQKLITADVIRRKAPLYSGTVTYTPPETMPPRPAGAKYLTSRDYQPGDMWSLGVILANVLGGSGIRLALMSSHDKVIFAEAQDRVIWKRLNKLPAALQQDKVPDKWTDVMDLLRSLTTLNPLERLTAAEVLEHPFLKKADLLARFYSS
jgi:serine/threonine protein kinase